jgi:hypothetical protein
MKNYPKGTKFNDWKLKRENQKGAERFIVVRWVRYPDGTATLERLPVAEYRKIRNNELEMRKLVLRLNDRVSREDRAVQAVELRHAFIDTALLDEFREYLLAQIPSRNNATTAYYYLTNYFLNFFINQLKMNDPLQWHEVHETKWAKYLLGPDVPGSAHSKRIIIATANRFMHWLHKKRPTEVPPLEFKPFTRARFKEIEAKRKMKGETRERKVVTDADWKRILVQADAEIEPFILLCYHYGLRRAESMGLQPADLRRGYLSVERQLVAYTNGTPGYSPLKGRQSRTVPHWFCKPGDAHRWISEALSNLMHPDTFSDRWEQLMKRLALDYDIHDLRHTWVTKAIRVQAPRDVQLAAGHKNIQTTMRYAHDDRELDSEVFEPDAS